MIPLEKSAAAAQDRPRAAIARDRMDGALTVMRRISSAMRDTGELPHDAIERVGEEYGAKLSAASNALIAPAASSHDHEAAFDQAAGGLSALNDLKGRASRPAAASTMLTLLESLAARLDDPKREADAIAAIERLGLMRPHVAIRDEETSDLNAVTGHAQKRILVAGAFRDLAAENGPAVASIMKAIEALGEAVVTLPQVGRDEAHRRLCEIAAMSGRDDVTLHAAMMLACTPDPAHAAEDAHRARIAVADLDIANVSRLGDILHAALITREPGYEASRHAGLRSLLHGIKNQQLRATLMYRLSQHLPEGQEANVLGELLADAAKLTDVFARAWTLLRLGMCAQDPVKSLGLVSAQAGLAGLTHADTARKAFTFPGMSTLGEYAAHSVPARERYFRAVDIAKAIENEPCRLRAYVALGASAPAEFYAVAFERLADATMSRGTPQVQLQHLLSLMFWAPNDRVESAAAIVTARIGQFDSALSADDAIRTFSHLAKLNERAEARQISADHDPQKFGAFMHEYLRLAASRLANEEARAGAIAALAAHPPVMEKRFAFEHSRVLIAQGASSTMRLWGKLLLAHSIGFDKEDVDTSADQLSVLARDIAQVTDEEDILDAFARVIRNGYIAGREHYGRELLLHLAGAIASAATRKAMIKTIRRSMPISSQAPSPPEARLLQALRKAIAAAEAMPEGG